MNDTVRGKLTIWMLRAVIHKDTHLANRFAQELLFNYPKD